MNPPYIFPVGSAVGGPALCCSAGTLHSSVTHMQCNYNAPQLWPKPPSTRWRQRRRTKLPRRRRRAGMFQGGIFPHLSFHLRRPPLRRFPSEEICTVVTLTCTLHGLVPACDWWRTLSKPELWQCGPRLRLSRSRALALSLWLRLNWQFSGLDSRARTALNIFRLALGRRLLTELRGWGGGERTQVKGVDM